MTRPATFWSGWAARLVLCGAASGCAVLTVDVDVYKGALVNEEHVQLHQLVALTTAAQPMLVQLRDSIEWPADEMPVRTFKDHKDWYTPGYKEPPVPPVPPAKDWFCKRADAFCPDPVESLPETGGILCSWFEWFCPMTKYEFFRNTMAVKVNAVLGLYEELDDKGKKVTTVEPGTERGLTALTKRYQNASRKSDQATSPTERSSAKSEREEAEHRLIDALVEFATKVLFLANHEGLASPPSTPGLILGGAEKLSRGLMGDFLTDKSMHAFFNSGLAETKTQQYVRVLQAVGNTILFSANELRERNRYEYDSRKKKAAEVAAANASYSSHPRKVVEDLLQELQQEKERDEQQLKAMTDRRDVLVHQVGTERPASGLYAARDNVSAEVAGAQNSLDNYLRDTRQPSALDEVLTAEARAKIKRLWDGMGKEAAPNLGDFFLGDDGLKRKLEILRSTQDGILTAEENRQFEDALKYIESADILKAFEAYRTENGKTSTKRSDVLDDFTSHIRQLAAERAKRSMQYEKVRDEKKQRQREVESRITTLTVERQNVDALISQLPEKIKRLQTAREVLREVAADAVADAEKTKQFVSPDAVYALLALNMDKRKEIADSDEKKKSYQEAQEVLSRRTPPPGLPPLNPKDYRSPIDVMDEVIALLRHRQMREVERFGSGSEQDNRATEALENAYQHRAGMIYIRPSSAYLRTSFPSTSLQDDPNLAWDNMLLKQGIRNLPFSSQLRDILDPSAERDRVLTAELDKQYWQNINRVRVSGVGFSNQALVKDDVGNWYVKRYYGDTEDIAKSAKHLALYSLGTRLPIDLAQELRKASVTKEESQKTEAEKHAERPPLQQVFSKHKAAYQTHTVEMSTRLTELHGKDGDNALYNQVLAAWEGVQDVKADSDFMATLKAALSEAVTQWDKTLDSLKKASDQERGLAITKDLHALAKLEKQLSARIRHSHKDEPSKAKAAKAADAVHGLVGPVLLELLKDHKQALDRYEQAVLFIGDAANPKDPKQEQEQGK